MGAQACCAATGYSTLDFEVADAPAVRLDLADSEQIKSTAEGTVQVKDQAQTCKECPDVGGTESEARWSEASTAAHGAAGDDASGLDACDACSSSAAASEPAMEVARAAEYNTDFASLMFEPGRGPKGMDLLTVTFKRVPLSVEGFAGAFQLLVDLTGEHIRNDFVTVFDISMLAIPSPFMIPKLLGVAKENLAHLESWRIYQQAFAVVRGNSSVMNGVVSALGTLSRAKNKPISAKDQAEAKALLSQTCS